jgi:NAD(P)-dependent dehydrogenase (short-subunit alcohol dehydrogenase family)
VARDADHLKRAGLEFGARTAAFDATDFAIRVNLIAPGFVDTPLSAAILGDQIEARREELRATLPLRRVVGPADIAALLMTNTAVTGATFDKRRSA